MNERKIYVDYMRAIAIILVVLGHINSSNGLIKNWIYEFHMPLFFFITGLTIGKKELSLKLLESKVKAIIVPFVLWGLIYMAYSEKNIAMLLYGSYWSISKAGSLTSLWFLPVLFIAYFIFQGLLKTKKRWIIGGLSLLVLIVGLLLPYFSYGYPWCINVSFVAVFFICIGWLCQGTMAKEYSSIQYSIIALIGFLITLLYGFDAFNNNSYVLMAQCNVGNPLIFIICSFGGFVFVYSLSKLLVTYVPKNKMLSFIGQNTLGIFVVHKPIIWILEKGFGFVTIPDFIQLIVICILCIIGSLIVVKVINKFLPAAIGRIS